jgi:hypothetical protein
LGPDVKRLRWVLAIAFVLHATGLTWGLPASDAWDNDGIAPRDILPGLAETFTPGSFYTYPPAHLVLLALLTLPVTVVAVVRAPHATVADVTQEILKTPYMTSFSVVARAVSLAMSLGIAIAIAKIAEEISPRKHAGVFAAASASFGITFTYYAHTSNLDVPSLFWASLAALAFTRAVARGEPSRLRRAAVFAAVAIATKDQAYALFFLSAPILLAWWMRRADDRKALAKECGVAFVIAVAVVLVLDGAPFNPRGFAARVAFLRGPASQDFSNYAGDVRGVWAILVDVAKSFDRHYPWIFVPLIVFGMTLVRGPAAAFPGLLAISFTVAFNFAARRTDDRFALPQMLFLSVYAGHALAWLASRWRYAPLPLLAWAAWEALRVDLMFLYEPRYATEKYLREHVGPEDTIEVHGMNVYLPRFPEGAHVVRVGSTPVQRRGPYPGIVEVQAPLMDIAQRNPRFIVVSRCYVWRYLPRDTSSHDGHVYPKSQLEKAQDLDATTFFTSLYEGRLGYRPVHAADIVDTWFRPIEIHASLNCKTTTFER